jgi:hypothetical protein
MNNDALIYTARDYSIYFEYNSEEMPWYTVGWEELFKNSNPVEKSIYYIKILGDRMKAAREALPLKYSDKILTIPFERFVVDPMPYMREIEGVLDSKITSQTHKTMKQQKVPRTKIADGIPLEVYKRCGWVPPREGLTEKEELQVRREYALQSASPEAMAVLDQMSAEYEAQFMNNIL